MQKSPYIHGILLYACSNQFIQCIIELNSLKVISNFQLKSLTLKSFSNVHHEISNSWTLMWANVSSTQNCPLECGKLNMRFLILIFAPKIATLRIFNYGNVMVSLINKFGFVARNISFSSFVMPSIKS